MASSETDVSLRPRILSDFMLPTDLRASLPIDLPASFKNFNLGQADKWLTPFAETDLQWLRSTACKDGIEASCCSD